MKDGKKKKNSLKKAKEPEKKGKIVSAAEAADEAVEAASEAIKTTNAEKAIKQQAKDEKATVLKAETKVFRERLMAQQQLIREAKLPIIVLVEGWAAAGKGSLINELISELDPRFYNVVSPAVLPESEARYPFLHQYASAIPENGKLMFYDSGWMEGAVRKYLHRDITKDAYRSVIRSVNEFERQLRDGGYIVLKLFLDISASEQCKRLSSLRDNYETEWRVTEDDLWQHRE